MTTLAIGRLSNRVASPDAETAMAAPPLLDRATRRLPEALAALLPRVLTEAGLPPDALVGLRRLDLKLHVTDAMDSDAVAARWADAIVTALRRRCRLPARHRLRLPARRQPCRRRRPHARAQWTSLATRPFRQGA